MRNNKHANGGDPTDGRTEQDIALLWQDEGVRAAYGERHRYIAFAAPCTAQFFHSFLSEMSPSFFTVCRRCSFFCCADAAATLHGASAILHWRS